MRCIRKPFRERLIPIEPTDDLVKSRFKPARYLLVTPGRDEETGQQLHAEPVGIAPLRCGPYSVTLGPRPIVLQVVHQQTYRRQCDIAVEFQIVLEFDGEMIAKADHVDLGRAAGGFRHQLVVLPLSVSDDHPDDVLLPSRSGEGAQSLQGPIEHVGMCRSALVSTKIVVGGIVLEMVSQIRVATTENIVRHQDRNRELTLECSNPVFDPCVGGMHSFEPTQ